MASCFIHLTLIIGLNQLVQSSMTKVKVNVSIPGCVLVFSVLLSSSSFFFFFFPSLSRLMFLVFCLSLVDNFVLGRSAARSCGCAETDSTARVLFNNELISAVESFLGAASKNPPRKTTAANVHRDFSISLFVCCCRVSEERARPPSTFLPLLLFLLPLSPTSSSVPPPVPH